VDVFYGTLINNFDI